MARPRRAATHTDTIPTVPHRYFASSQFRERPSWWTPEKVLSDIENGEHPILVCQRAAAEINTRVTVQVLRRDIAHWAESASWGSQFTAALKLHPRTVARSLAGKLSKKWYPDFYTAMAREDVGGKIELACHFADVGPELVYALRDKRNKCYDDKFDEQCRILEGRRFSKIRENFLDEAATNGKIAAIALESGMPNLHAKATKLEVSGGLAHTVDHRLSAEVVEATGARQRALLGSRTRGALQAPTEATSFRGPVIEAEYVEVRTKGKRG